MTKSSKSTVVKSQNTPAADIYKDAVSTRTVTKVQFCSEEFSYTVYVLCFERSNKGKTDIIAVSAASNKAMHAGGLKW